MGEAKRRTIQEAANRIAKSAGDKGELIEIGWQSLRAVWVPPDAGPEQLSQLREAFFAGAQHLFGSIMGILDPGAEPTDDDLRRMDLIKSELDSFIRDFELRRVPTQGTA